jgi:predicted HTH transcriptional regulator
MQGFKRLLFLMTQLAFRIEFLKSTVKSTEKTLELIKSNPNITVFEMAKELGASKSKMEKLLAKLKSANQIKRIGAVNGGHWEVVE